MSEALLEHHHQRPSVDMSSYAVKINSNEGKLMRLNDAEMDELGSDQVSIEGETNSLISMHK